MAHIRNDLTTGTRIYVQTAYGEPIVAALKKLGCHWDKDAKCWWIGAAKKAALQDVLVASDQHKDAGGPDKVAENLDDARVHAQVEYRGRKYYVIAETQDLTRCRLTTLDGMAPFWADCADCNLIRRYEPREVWDGRYCSGKTRKEYQTIGSLRRFRDKQQEARQSGQPACAACGKHGRLVHDMEDGLEKCYSCCDMPAE